MHDEMKKLNSKSLHFLGKQESKSQIRKTSQCSVYKYPLTNSVHLMCHALKPIVKFKFRGLLGSAENVGIRGWSSSQEAGQIFARPLSLFLASMIVLDFTDHLLCKLSSR